MFGMEHGNETEAGSGPGPCTVECPVLTSASVVGSKPNNMVSRSRNTILLEIVKCFDV